MSSKRVKMFKKEARKVIKNNYDTTLHWLQGLPFKDRLKIAFKIVKGRKP